MILNCAVTHTSNARILVESARPELSAPIRPLLKKDDAPIRPLTATVKAHGKDHVLSIYGGPRGTGSTKTPTATSALEVIQRMNSRGGMRVDQGYMDTKVWRFMWNQERRAYRMRELKRSRIDWWALAGLLPTGSGVDSERQRKALFDHMDIDDDEVVNLAEAERGVLQLVMGLELCEVDPRPVVASAFRSVRAVQVSLMDGETSKWLIRDPDGTDEDFAVTRPEFIQMLHDLRYYFELYAIFQEADGEVDDDESITEKEFLRSLNKIEAWAGRQILDGKGAFMELDEDQNGRADIDEFFKWALKNKLNRDPGHFGKRHKKVLARGTVDWGAVSKLLPCFRDPESKRQRMALFNKFDKHNDGVITFQEAEEGVLLLLKGMDLLNMDIRPTIHQAFESVKPTHQKHSKFSTTIDGHEVVEKNEFRMLLASLRYYMEVYAWFQSVDDGASNDEMISKYEFMRAVPEIRKLGARVDDAQEAWRELDYDKSGSVNFAEFLDWCVKHKLDDRSDNVGDDENEFDFSDIEANLR